MSHATLDRIEGLVPDRETLLTFGLILNLELIVVLVYVILSEAHFTAIRYLVYPWVWINVGAWAVLRTRPKPSSTKNRRLAIGVAIGYFALLAYVGGIVGVGGFGTGFRIAWLPPGWGPTLIYGGESLQLVLVPFKLLGYLALTYLVYATILDAAGSAFAGLIGLLSCVSCTIPVLATLLTGVLGGTVGFAASGFYALSYDLSTVVYVLSIGLLYWRPTLETFQ